MKGPVSVYVHIPFCPSKCGYCDFNSYAMSGPIVDRTVEAIGREIARSPWRGVPARTIFFGGGTPTFLPEDRLCKLLEAVLQAHPPIADCEITSEANPGTVDASKFSAMRRAGFNRLSIGAQSFRNEDLVRLDRVHQAGDIGRAVGLAREAGFDNLNLDLMFALPRQTAPAWERNLRRAIALAPEHLSLYCLTVEQNTRFYKLQLRGELEQPGDDAQVSMYETSLDLAAAHGYSPYEISNFAKPGYECRHNLAYWRGEPYAGYGPGAVGCMEGKAWGRNGTTIRYTNLKHPERYSAAIEAGDRPAYDLEELDEPALRIERLMLGLRLDAGIPEDQVRLPAEGVRQALARGWIESVEGNWRLTRSGKHFCSEATLLLV